MIHLSPAVVEWATYLGAVVIVTFIAVSVWAIWPRGRG